MNKSLILNTVQKHVTLDATAQEYFSSILITQHLKQGDFIERANEITSGLIYVNTGCLMTYFTDTNAHDHVIQFAFSGWWTGDLHSITKNIPSIYSTRALVDSEVLLLGKHQLEDLFQRHPIFERYFRITFQNSLVTHQNRIIQNFSVSAEERYYNFQEKYPSLEQFVPLKYIASYLGITPEFLSKIRRKRL